MLMLLSGATWQPTDEARHLVEALQRALHRAGICPKEAASLQLISDKQWDNQIHGRCGSHVSLFRVGLLVIERPDVLVLWLQELAVSVHAQVITDTQMRALIDKMQTLILQLQASDAYRPMLKAELPAASAPQKERVS
jgi:hypothetical protein